MFQKQHTVLHLSYEIIKIYLHVRFGVLVNQFSHVLTCARAIAGVSRRRLDLTIVKL